MKNERRFTINAAATGDAQLYTLDELNRMADEIVETAADIGSAPKGINALDHVAIWAKWNAPKTGAK